MNTSRFRSLLFPVVLALACSLTPAHAAVLYDTRDMVINGLHNGRRESIIGGFGRYGFFTDTQAGQKFSLADAAEFTSITVDFWHQVALVTPADGWLVEVFAVTSGTPSEVPAHAVYGLAGTRLGSFPIGGLPNNATNTPDHRSTFEIDLTGQGFTLGAGEWLISVVAVDESPFGTAYRWVGGAGTGGMRRAGGLDHGNGYPPFDTTPIDWAPQVDIAQHSMRIEGTIIPAPAATALLSLCGLTTALNRRRRG